MPSKVDYIKKLHKNKPTDNHCINWLQVPDLIDWEADAIIKDGIKYGIPYHPPPDAFNTKSMIQNVTM